ncbi:hypothetical protein [Cohnella algarum]|uniref:amino acid kinase family protein n=1 Tax=Cohnella algarum TaxID=2044859 RepID=UPI003B834919
MLKHVEECKQLAASLVEAGKNKRIVLFPGGGEIDNYIESYHKKFPLKRDVFHHTTMLSLDQTGLLFSNFEEDLIPFKSFIECRRILEQRKVAVFLPSDVVFGLDPFRYTNRISSDGMALYMGHLLEVAEVVILKSIEGLLDQNKQVIPEINFDDFANLKQDCVDETFPLLAKQSRTPITILNGLEADRVYKWLTERDLECGTLIV